MARVLRISAGAVALAFIISASPAFSETSGCGTNCGGGNGGGGPTRDTRDDRFANQRDPVITEPTEVEDFVFVAPPVFQLPASNSPATRGFDGQIRSSWAVGVFR